METIDLKQLLKDCMDKAKTITGSAWNDLKPYAEHEFTQFTEDAIFLTRLKATGVIDDTAFKTRMDMQKRALQDVLLTIEGIGLVTAQDILNGIFDIVAKAIFAAIGIPLPV